MPQQLSLFDAEATRSLLDRLIADSRLYRSGKDFQELLDFIARMPHIAPFNGMLLQIQKPGLKYAMSAKDWRDRYGRYPKEGSRPLIIMWPFGPVGFVFDVVDTEGYDLPADVFSFAARGNIGAESIERFKVLMERKHIHWHNVDQGDAHAGLVRVLNRSEDNGNSYRININKNHGLATQFATLAHELGHVFLGHLGADQRLKVKDRHERSAEMIEIEAESVSHIVCSRAGVESRSEPYLSVFVDNNAETDSLDVYAILVAAGAVETLLELNPKAFRARME